MNLNLRRSIVLFIGLLAALLVGSSAAAQAETTDDGFVLRVNGTTSVGATEVTDSVFAINGDVVVDGTVSDTLAVVKGDATVTGMVTGEVVMIDGTLNLKPGASVGDVTLMRGTLNQEQGATITGELNERSEFVNFGWGRGIFSFVFWLGTTIVVLLAGLAYAALGGRQLSTAGGLLTGRPGASLLAAAIVWISLRILAVLALVTIVGIPLGLAVLFFVLPVLWFVGYLVAGARLGAVLARRFGGADAPDRPYLAAILGLFVFQVIALVPIVGGLVVALAGFVGAGGLGYLAFRGRGERRLAISRRSPAPAT
jgi:cytoskeletal protein CcmA (bactofilin family)